MTSVELASVATLVAGSFAATNLDNLLILVALLGAAPRRRFDHGLGFLLAAVCILAVCLLGSLLGAFVDPAYLGYLGLAPLAMGLHLLFRQLRPGQPAGAVDVEISPAAREEGGWPATALLMLGNSADSLAVFLPLAMESRRAGLLWGSGFYLATAVAWIALALFIAGHPRVGQIIRAAGEKLVPAIMIAVGIYILMDTAGDTL